jgi:hypothetical protein
MEVEYGIYPLRNIIKKRKIYPSIITFGAQNYCNLMDSLNKNPLITVIPGAEVGPTYYWSGNLFEKNLVLHNWHQHLLILGLDKGEDYSSFPSTSADIFQGSGSHLLYAISAGLGIILGIILFTKEKIKSMKFSGQILQLKTRPYRLLGILLLSICSLYLINDYPFQERLDSPYKGDPNPRATQRVIDYAISRSALVYYAHPEAGFVGELEGIKLETQPYANLLLETRNYTGFAVFMEGWKHAGIPGGEWDQTLYQYCNGQREKPVWIIGESEFEGELTPEFLRETNTFVWAKDKTRKGLLEALANGRCYAAQIWAPTFISLDKWSVSAISGEERISGETLITDSTVILHFSFSTDPIKENFEALVIRNGRQIASVPFDESFTMDFDDNPSLGKNYYRLWVYYRDTPCLATNPIFVEHK